MDNVPCYICGKQAQFWSSRFEQSFCSDMCYSKVFDLLIRDYNFRVNGEVEERKTYDIAPPPMVPTEIQGDFAISGATVTLLKHKEKVKSVIDKIDAEVVASQSRASEEDKMRKDLKKMGIDIFTIESMIKAKREPKS